MSEYSVATTNRFALSSIDDEEDLFELLEKQQEEKKRKEELAAEAAKAAASKGKHDKKGSAKGNTKKVAVKVPDAKPSQTTNNTKNYQNTRNDENLPPRFSRQAKDAGENQNFERPPQSEGFGDRGRRGFSAGRGGRGAGRGGFGGGRPPRRQYERHSGSDKTGVKAVEKREGGGPHNWGDEIEAQLEQQPEVQTESRPEQDSGEEKNETQEPEVVEEEPKVMTLDEWKASQSKTAKADFKVRQANEGVDTKQWKGTVALEKKKKGDMSDEGEDDEDLEDEPEVDETRATLEKLNIQITFADNSRGVSRGRGRGGRGFNRGGPRSGGRRGGFGGKQDRGYVPRVDNESDFPSLGSR